MIIRPYKKGDEEELSKLMSQHNFNFPLTNLLSIFVVEDEGRIIAWGVLKQFVEAIFMPDKTAQKRDIIESLKLLNTECLNQSRLNKIEQVHSFITDEKFQEVLIKHFGYGECTGKALFLNVA